MTVVTLLDITPPERYDSVAWMAWHIEEGSVEAGPFVEIDNKPLSPIDPDPRYPAARDLTTDNGSAEGMWYRVRFRDVNNQFSSYSAPIHNAPSVDLPNIRQVALHIRSRTVTRNTNEFRGTFTHETRPTADEAAEAVEIARDDVLTDVGKLPDGLQAEAYAAVQLTRWFPPARASTPGRCSSGRRRLSTRCPTIRTPSTWGRSSNAS